MAAHRLALLTASATAVLIVAGGLVTNTGAALAVPDWPTTFGHNMFLFPWSGMVGGIFYEHSHRLLGALVGLLTVALAVVLRLTERRTWLARWGLLAVVMVGAQGLIGGLRVVLVRDALAIVHGCLAQGFFALTVALAVVTSRGWQAPLTGRAPADGRTAAWLGVAALTALYLQIVLGALTTHAGWIALHLAGTVVAVALPAAVAFRVLADHGRQPVLAWPARVLALLLGLQVALGLGAYVVRFTGWALPGGAVGVLALPVAHRLTASLLLGAAVTLTLHAWRVGGPRPVSRPDTATEPALGSRVPA